MNILSTLFLARILLFFPLYVTLRHERNYIKRLPRIATCDVVHFERRCAFSKGTFPNEMYVCMYVYTVQLGYSECKQTEQT